MQHDHNLKSRNLKRREKEDNNFFSEDGQEEGGGEDWKFRNRIRVQGAMREFLDRTRGYALRKHENTAAGVYTHVRRRN